MISAGCIRAATCGYESVKTPAARKAPSVGNGSHAPVLGVFGVLRGLIRPFPSLSERLFRSVSLQKGLNLIRPTRTCALHHSAVIRLNFVVCSVGTLPGFAPLRILSTKRRHGVACQESSPRTPSVRRSPAIPGRPIAASERLFSRRGDRLRPFPNRLHRRRPPPPLVARCG
jgi:hypothetical protein